MPIFGTLVQRRTDILFPAIPFFRKPFYKNFQLMNVRSVLLLTNSVSMTLSEITLQSSGSWLKFARNQFPNHLPFCNFLYRISVIRRYPRAFLIAAAAQWLTFKTMYELFLSPTSGMYIFLKTASSLNVLRRRRTRPCRIQLTPSLRIHALSVRTVTLSHGDQLILEIACRMMCIGPMIAE